MSNVPLTGLDPSRFPTEDDLNRLQLTTLEYYLHEANPANGLIRDKTEAGAPASIAAVGLAMASIPVLVERGVISREFAPELALQTLRFFRDSPQGPEPDATGYRGFYYHFLHMKTGRRVWQCELSTIDSAFLFAGMLTCAAYFDADTEEEAEVRRIADELYRRADWKWALNGGAAVSHGWRPETGFIPYTWTGYDEALLVYLLGLGSPTFPLPAESYATYTSTYQWKEIYGRQLLYSGPLFTHQLSHLWVDFRGIRDAFMRDHDSDYFENTRQATYVHQEYARRNPRQFAGYGEWCWGITASEGPGPAMLEVNGVTRRFFDYVARGVPRGPDDVRVAYERIPARVRGWLVAGIMGGLDTAVSAFQAVRFAVEMQREFRNDAVWNTDPDFYDPAGAKLGTISACTSTPTSITVVLTRMSKSRFTNFCITASFSADFRRP